MTEQLSPIPEAEAVQPRCARDQLRTILAYELREAGTLVERAARELADYPADDAWMPVPRSIVRAAETALANGTDDELRAAASALRHAILEAVCRAALEQEYRSPLAPLRGGAYVHA